MAGCLQLLPARADCSPDWSMHDAGTAKKQWTQLCDQAAVEKDPEKLMVLVKEIIRTLDEKERRLKYRNSDTQTEER